MIQQETQQAKDYDSETYDKSYISGAIDTMFGEGELPDKQQPVEDAVNYLSNLGRP